MLGSRVSQHDFARIPASRVPRSVFDRSFALKDTMDFDYLVPVFVDEVVPGDVAHVSVQCFVALRRLLSRLWTMLMSISFSFLFRLVWFGTIGRSSWVLKTTQVIRLII